ncbi:MAG: hypothetical protein II412_04470 [Clostridia bacterium]|nr:hypothetical protein [Clostridia bacterium]
MEQKKDPNWKKLLSKGAFAVSCIVISVLLLGAAVYLTLRVRRGCSRSGYVSEATPTPAPTPLPDRVYSADKNPPFAPPLDALDISQGHLDEYAELLSDATRWIDLTPEGAKGFTVIRSIDLGCSYVAENGKYYRLGEGEDGKGVVDVLLTDLDLDDEPDLLYTYHFGANEDAFSKVGWFRFTTHTSALSGFAQKEGFLSLLEEDGNYILFRAVRDANLDTGTFGLTLTERLGEITETMDRIELIMDPRPTPEAPAAE